MSQATDLVRFILEDPKLTDEKARDIIDMALGLEVDPLAFLAQRFSLSDTLVMERAAAWAGLAFFPKVPSKLPDLKSYDGVGDLGPLRHLRGRLIDREVVFCAPYFHELIRLKGFLVRRPDNHRFCCVVPQSALAFAMAEANAQVLLDASRQRLSRLWPFATAALDLPAWVRIAFALGTIGLTVLALMPMPVSALFLPIALLVLLGPAVIRLAACATREAALELADEDLLDDADLPVYTVMVPLRDEADMVPLLARSLTALDYPPEKLDIKFVVEQSSGDTITRVLEHIDQGPFDLVVVPDAAPRTKPKALNFALPLARGEHVVVFDAEDIAEPRQLRLAASLFARHAGIDCLQAELVIDNADENALTGFFAGEYAGLFRVVLPAMARWNLPLPLGGTSNHFRLSVLRDLGGWDAFNVTEDADIGVRLARSGKTAAVMASRTREEAPHRLAAWLRQRTRWMKGWMQTLIVHNRRPAALLADLGWRRFACFQAYTIGTILSPLLHTLFLIFIVLRLTVPGLGWPLGFDIWTASQWIILVAGYGAAIAVSTIGAVRTKRGGLLPLLPFLPLYWCLHSLATGRALWELVRRPYFWAKTAHGQTKVLRGLAFLPSPAPSRTLRAIEIKNWYGPKNKV